MADYAESSSTTIGNYTSSTLSTETITAITTALGNTTTTIITTIETTTIFTQTENIVIAVDANFTGDLNAAAGDVDVIDGSSATAALEIDFSAKEESTEQPENIIIGSDFDDTLVTNDNEQIIEAGGGDDSITTGTSGDSISGGAGNDSIATGEGNDSISAGTGNDSVDGGVGFDVVLVSSSVSEQTIIFNGSIFTTTDSSGNTVTIENTQIIQFGSDYQESHFILNSKGESEIASLFDVFGRKAGAGGLEFFTKAAERPAGLAEVAQTLIDSEEGQNKSFDTMSNSDFVAQMFLQFTDRAGREAGLKHFTDSLDSGVTTKADIMASFVQTTEVTTITETFIHVVGVDETIG